LALADTGEYIDVTVCYPNQRASATNDGAACRAAEERKRARYPHGRLVPAALEALGRPGDALVAFVRRLHRHLPLRERAAGVADAWATLSAALQRGNANLVASAGRPARLLPPAGDGGAARAAAQAPVRATRARPY